MGRDQAVQSDTTPCILVPVFAGGFIIISIVIIVIVVIVIIAITVVIAVISVIKIIISI